MSEHLWCPECREWWFEEPSWLFAQRCQTCGTVLEGEPPPVEIDFKEIDIDYSEEDNETEDAEGNDAEAE